MDILDMIEHGGLDDDKHSNVSPADVDVNEVLLGLVSVAVLTGVFLTAVWYVVALGH